MKIKLNIDTKEIFFKTVAGDVEIYCRDAMNVEYLLAEVIVFEYFVRVRVMVDDGIDWFNKVVKNHPKFIWNEEKAWQKVEFIYNGI